MGFVLDAIVKKLIVEGPEAAGDGFISDAVDIDGIEGAFSIQFDYDGGVAVSLTLYLQVSTDGVTFVDFTGSEQAITDASGTHIWDLPEGTGTSFLRLRIEGSGSIDIQKVLLSGKRRH